VTQIEIDRLWQQALRKSFEYGEQYTRYRFAAMVAAAEREACAKVCDDATDGMCSFKWMAHHCAAAIRARGEK
jgi:hypothetical protein